jgi:hypothetical protein
VLVLVLVLVWVCGWISREISQASASTVRAHFGCIFKATVDCTTGVWCVFYVHILDT